jgi:small basic protein
MLQISNFIKLYLEHSRAFLISEGKTAIVKTIKSYGKVKLQLALILNFGIRWINGTASRRGRLNAEE